MRRALARSDLSPLRAEREYRAARAQSGERRAAKPRNTHTRRAKPRAASSEGVPRSDFPRAAPVALRSARVHAPARGARAPRRRAGGAKERRARGATDGTREEDQEERTTAARDVPAELRRREPPAIYARRARRARVTRRPPCVAPSLRTERRPKRRRETRTTAGDGTREEQEGKNTAARDVPAELRRREPPAMYARRARRPSPRARRALAPQGAATEEKTPDEDEDRRRGERRGRDKKHRGTAARDVPAEVQRLEPPTRAPRTARRRRACASASPRPARSARRRAKAARRVCAPAAGRTTSTDKCGGSGRRVSGAWDARTVRSIDDPKRGRTRAVGRALERQQTIARARPGTSCGGVRRGLVGSFHESKRCARCADDASAAHLERPELGEVGHSSSARPVHAWGPPAHQRVGSAEREVLVKSGCDARLARSEAFARPT